MNDKKKRFPMLALVSLVFFVFLGAAFGGGGTTQASLSPRVSKPVTETSETQIKSEADRNNSTVSDLDSEPDNSASAPNPWTNYPNACETFTVIQSSKRVRGKKGKWHYPIRYKRNRYHRSREDRVRTRKLVKMVAEEMGVKHPEFFDAFALHESTWNPEAIHILNPDLEANHRAWERHTYNRAKEKKLTERLSKANARKKEFWKIKAELADTRMYKGNTHWDDRLAYDYVIPAHTVKIDGEETLLEEQRVRQSQTVWGFGYGLYGMNAVGFVRMWDREAPPWVLCGDEGIVATIVAVWAARNAVQECNALSARNPDKWGKEGGTYKGAVRRVGRGHCSDRRLGKVWRRLFKEFNSVPWDSPADFGDKWPMFEMKKRRGKWVHKKDENGNRIPTDREAILAHMIKKAEAKGLLREDPLDRRKPSHHPEVVARRGGGSSGAVSAP